MKTERLLLEGGKGEGTRFAWEICHQNVGKGKEHGLPEKSTFRMWGREGTCFAWEKKREGNPRSL